MSSALVSSDLARDLDKTRHYDDYDDDDGDDDDDGVGNDNGGDDVDIIKINKGDIIVDYKMNTMMMMMNMTITMMMMIP